MSKSKPEDYLVVEQDRTPWLQKVLIHKGQDTDIVL